MDEKTFDEQIKARGLSIVGFVVESVTLDDESEKKIDDYELAANSHMQQGKLVGSYANAVEAAANNANGAANGFMGIGMMNMASNGIIGGATTGPWQNAQNNNQAAVSQTTQAQQNQAQSSGWECPNCKNIATGNFCTNCGTKKPEAKSAKFCPKCGAKVDEGSKFCPECGEKVE